MPKNHEMFSSNPLLRPILMIVLAGLVVGGLSCGKANPQVSKPGSVSNPVLPEHGRKRPEGPLEKRYTQVTDDLGPLIIRPSDMAVERIADQVPWSSYYFPLNDPIFFKDEGGDLSPLEKYRRFAREFANPPVNKDGVIEKERQLYEQIGAGRPAWMGNCHAWSYASLTALEPGMALTRKKIGDLVFEISDLKALLIKGYEAAVPPRHYGIEYHTGPDNIDFNDIYPDQFHRFLQVELFEQGNPFVIDTDPDVEIWNYPVYEAWTEIERDKADPGILHVTTGIDAADLLQKPSWRSTDFKLKRLQYTYDLVGDVKPDGSVAVVFGEWTGKSLFDHPDYVIPIAPKRIKAIRASRNPDFDPAIVDQILRLPGV